MHAHTRTLGSTSNSWSTRAWQQRALYSFYLIYWYKSTNTDAEGKRAWQQSVLCSIYLLYLHKSANPDPEGGA